MTVALFLQLACGAMAALFVSFLALQRSLTRAKRMQEYQARVLRRAEPVAAAPRAPRRSLVQAEKRSINARFAGLIGYNPDSPEQYRVKWWVVLLGSALPGAGLAWLTGFLLSGASWTLLPVFMLALTRYYLASSARKFQDKLFRQFPDALDLIVRAVRVGIPVAEGIRTAARESMQPTAGIFQRMADELSIGVALEDALRSVTRRYGTPEYRFFAVAIGLQAQTGGGLSETLETLGGTIRKRVAAKERGLALAAEARMSSLVLAVLPIFAVGGLMLVSPGYLAPLIEDPMGKYLIFAAVLLEAGGVGAMQMLIRKALR